MTTDNQLLDLALGLMALRSVLWALISFLDWADTRDGRRDWPWVRKMANVVEALDNVLEYLPVKAPLKKGRG